MCLGPIGPTPPPTPASYPHTLCPKARQRRVLLPNVYGVYPSHNMHRIPLPEKHHAISRSDSSPHRIIPSFHLFSGLFHQSFLGETSTRRGSREEGIPQSGIGFHCGWDVDCHFCLRSEPDGGALFSGILSCHNDPCHLVGYFFSKPFHLESVGHRNCRSGAFVVRLNLFGEKGDLAARRAVPAKVYHSVVRSTLRLDTILP